jgi:membrane protein
VGPDAETEAADRVSETTTVTAALTGAMSFVDRVRRALRLGVQAAGRGVVEFYNSENLTFAASIAYYTLLSIFPFILLVSTILSKIALVQGRAAVDQVIQRALPQQFKFLSDQITTLAQTPIPLNVLGVLLTLWASMGVFGAITSAVNHAWGVETNLGFFKHKLVSFLLLIGAGLMMLLTLVLMSLIEIMEARWFADAVAHYPWLTVFEGFLYRTAPTPMFIFIVGLVYYYVPNAKVRLRDVWVGAILAGVLWRLAFHGFSLLVRESRLGVHGTISTVVVFLIWVYISAVILLYGVEVTAAYARLRKHLPQSAPAAPARDA